MTEGPDLSALGPDDPPPPSMMCEVCHGVLTPSTTWEDIYSLESDEPVRRMWTVSRWNHPDGGYDHEPVPVPTDFDVALAKCDFCSAPEVTGWAVATPFNMTYRGVITRDSGLWACCAECRALLETGGDLIARTTSIMRTRFGQMAGEPTRLLQEAFLDHFTGEITDRRPVSHPDGTIDP
jgi:hypothetical protein